MVWDGMYFGTSFLVVPTLTLGHEPPFGLVQYSIHRL